jgi:hypothetical protein
MLERFDRRRRAAQHLEFGLCLASVFVWLAIGLAWRGAQRLALVDYGVPVGLLVLFLALPSGFGAVLWLRRGPRPPLEAARRGRRMATLAFLGVTWTAAAMFVGSLAALVPAWPFTLREGPDTDFARAGFVRVFGVEPPASVSGLYYRVDGPRDPVFLMRCTGVERALLEQAAWRLDLPAAMPVFPTAAAGERVPAWWPEQAPEFDAAFARGYEALWYAEAGGLVLYRCQTF